MRTFIWLISITILIIVGVVVFKHRTPEIAPVQQAAPSALQQQALQQTAQSAATQPAPAPTTHSAITTKDGMNIETITQGTGPEIKAGQTAVVQYEGRLADGSVFDSTAKHGGTPFDFKLGAGMVIKGWDEGVLGMKVGETRILTIPPELGYGPQGYPPIIPQNATLTFTVTLQAIK